MAQVRAQHQCIRLLIEAVRSRDPQAARVLLHVAVPIDFESNAERSS